MVINSLKVLLPNDLTIPQNKDLVRAVFQIWYKIILFQFMIWLDRVRLVFNFENFKFIGQNFKLKIFIIMLGLFF